MNTGNKNPIVVDDNSSFSQQSTSSPLAFASVRTKYSFPPLNDSNSFRTVDYDAHNNTKVDYSINHVFISMTVQELKTLHHICEMQRTQLLTIVAMSVKNLQLVGYVLTGNRSYFFHAEGSTA